MTIGGLDTREAAPASLVGLVASVFQDPEDQAVMTRVANEVAFGLENTGVPPAEIWARVEEALASVGAEHLAERPVAELSAGELQRVCLASALALRPRLLLLDEPTSQLDPEAAESFFDLIEHLPCAVLVSEQRPARPLARADRVLFMDDGRITLDAPRAEAIAWLAEHRPLYLPHAPGARLLGARRAVLLRRPARCSRAPRSRCAAARSSRSPVRTACGKTTLAQIAAGLLEPDSGHGRARSARRS